jgi:hypothetical protein
MNTPGEPLYVFQRQAIAETLECPVIEEYGSGELGSVAFECPHGALHVTAENVFLETVPAEDGGGKACPLALGTGPEPWAKPSLPEVSVVAICVLFLIPDLAAYLSCRKTNQSFPLIISCSIDQSQPHTQTR